MQFKTLFTSALFATAAVANSITFNNLDGIAKKIHFTGNLGAMAGCPEVISLAPHATAKWSCSGGFVGNAYSVNEGEPNVPGMLAEVNFADDWQVWFDVSAIVDKNDNKGVKKLWSSIPSDPVSGCDSYASLCPNAYNFPDAVQTKSTTSRDLFCSVGLAGATKREEKESFRSHARDFLRSVREAVDSVVA